MGASSSMKAAASSTYLSALEPLPKDLLWAKRDSRLTHDRHSTQRTGYCSLVHLITRGASYNRISFIWELPICNLNQRQTIHIDGFRCIPPEYFRNSASNYATNVSFHIVYNSPFINFPMKQCCIGRNMAYFQR
jgi:hypothetical protein